jgi:hypothetical protein
MFIQVLDLIVPGGRRPRHPRWENLEPVKVDTVDSVQQPVVTDSIDTLQNGNAVTDTISNSSLEVMSNNLGTGAGNTPSVLWTLFFVIVALAICFYLIFAYRRHLASPRNR